MFPRFLVGLVGSGFAAVSLAASGASRVAPKIEVGPNMLLSRDGNFPHVGVVLAANPKNAKNMVGGAVTYEGEGVTGARGRSR